MQSNRIYREHETSFVCKIAGQERSFCVRKIRRTYHKLNSMAFVANARPEQSDTHSCSLNKGIGWESRTRKESLLSVCSLWIIECKGDGRIPKVAVFLKYCFPCREICARWKPVIGRAVMAPREGWSNAFARKRGRGLRDCKASRAWMDQSEDLQKAKPEKHKHHSRKLRC